MILESLDTYMINRIGPRHDPWGTPQQEWVGYRLSAPIVWSTKSDVENHCKIQGKKPKNPFCREAIPNSKAQNWHNGEQDVRYSIHELFL